MANIPVPARRKTKQYLLETLMSMGYPKNRALKALSATGDNDVQLAADWLLSHANDPYLDECVPRAFTLYAHPTGPLLMHLSEFWQKSLQTCGWNRAHNFPLHITLVVFFPVYKVIEDYTPKVDDELELVAGDLIYIEKKQFDSSPDGWVQDTSWLTGMSSRAYPHEDAETLGREKSEESYKEWAKYWTAVQSNDTGGIIRVTQGPHMDWQPLDDSGDVAVTSQNKANSRKSVDSDRRWIFAMRHGERVDLTYGQWTGHCFDQRGQYMRKDLNMPLSLGKRAGGAESYARDTPLTRVGQLQAQLVGEGLRLAGVSVAHVYASAALRCVETAHHLLEGLKTDLSVKIKVEPGLFEYKLWHMAKGMAPFMTPRELQLAGYNVDVNYKPYVDLDVQSNETIEEYYQRNRKVMQSALGDTENEGGNIIFVGHAATLDTMVVALSRLRDGTDTGDYQISKHLLRVPYCALAAMRDCPLQLVPPPCPPSINSSSGRFNWKLLQDS